MKKFIITFLCFSISLVYSQIGSETNLYKGENLYIEIPFAPKHRVSDKNITIESYLLEIGSSCNEGKKIKFEALHDGTLKKDIILTGKNLPTIKIVYTNKHDDNKSINIDSNKIQNFITYEEIKYSSIDNLLWVTSQFKNIYIVTNKNRAKKVQLEEMPSL